MFADRIRAHEGRDNSRTLCATFVYYDGVQSSKGIPGGKGMFADIKQRGTMRGLLEDS